jgi:hypothetical protein
VRCSAARRLRRGATLRGWARALEGWRRRRPPLDAVRVAVAAIDAMLFLLGRKFRSAGEIPPTGVSRVAAHNEMCWKPTL